MKACYSLSMALVDTIDSASSILNNLYFSQNLSAELCTLDRTILNNVKRVS